MASAVRALLAVVAGMALAFVLVVAVEYFSSVVHPFPANFDGNIPAHGDRIDSGSRRREDLPLTSAGPPPRPRCRPAPGMVR